ncbi:HNH endonuclease [Gordonia phage BrutonGaster]|uniref:HNH endonuclease n=1 Tax=Gordonia phage BrutonGaster TaxID=2530116 RepID=A0A482JN39_9CAUD|nr:HNH endonuclease [Gordonia phage BrutonGaster]QBP33254.1 HNH endonuclease [Gordonia phage BrutonGaster]
MYVVNPCKQCGADRNSLESTADAAKTCQLCRRAYQYRRRSQRKCSVEGCARLCNNVRFCYVHARVQTEEAQTCSVNDCLKRVQAKGLCSSHYQASRREAVAKRRRQIGCRVSGCPKPLLAKGLCKSHYDATRREELLEVERRWRQKNRDKVREKIRRRQARKRELDVRAVADRDLLRLRNRQLGRCFYCDDRLAAGQEHVDHVVPMSRGGRHSIGNLVIACAGCNCSKSDWFLYEWKLNQTTGRPLIRRSRAPV